MLDNSFCQLAVIGLGVMGTNLCRNLISKGYKVAGYDISVDSVANSSLNIRSDAFFATTNIEELVNKLEKPRKLIILISPGAPVDACISSLSPLLSKGDIILDCGNSNYIDTERRQRYYGDRSIHIIGVGTSGGKEGALNGPSLMPGGDAQALQQVMGILESIAAKVDQQPCVKAIGPAGSGHFVKTVHNGIEYGLMQAIAEVYDIFRSSKFSANEISEIFEKWSKGSLGSFLMEVSSKCLSKIDAESGKNLVNLIGDRAEQKGTGKWTIIEAFNLSVPCGVLAAAVEARNISANLNDRTAVGAFRSEYQLADAVDKQELIQTCEKALLFAYLVCYSQGFSILDAASREYKWNLNLSEIAFIWKAGCIIRSVLLDDIQVALQNQKESQLLLGRKSLHETVDKDVKALRQTLTWAMKWEVPTPVLSACLSYFDSLKAEKLPQNLVQAQRDFFGGHKFKRTDKEGYFSINWEQSNSS
jgi:6-phosphogluconate dehydrogenase